MQVFAILIFIKSINLIRADAPPLQSCEWNISKTKSIYEQPEIFWINMDKSMDRRRSIEKHLDMVGLLHRRVRGLNTFKDIYFPEDIVSNWNKMEAKVHTDEIFPDRITLSKEGIIKINQYTYNTSLLNFTHVMTGLIGRAKKNKLKELGCTSSHLEAMRQVSLFLLIHTLF